MAISIRSGECDQLVARLEKLLGPGRTKRQIVTMALAALEKSLNERVPLREVVGELRARLGQGR